MRSKAFFSFFCLVQFCISASQAYYADIAFVTDNVAPTGAMSNLGGAAYHPVLPGTSVVNMNVAGTYGNGAVSVPMYPQSGYNDNELLIWNDNTPDEQQVMRLTFSSPVNLREVGIVADFSGVGAGSDRFGKEPSFRINGGDWMVYGDPAYNWGLSADVMNWWDYACVTGSFTNVTTVDYRLGDWTAGYSPRIGAVTALGNLEPVQVWNLNSDLANAGGWSANSPVVGPWSMGWSYSLGSQTLFNTWVGGESFVWHTPLSDHFNPGAGGNPDGSTTPHGGYSAGQCILAAANYITGDDNVYEPGSGETYSVYSVVRWTAPAAMEAAITGSFIPLNPGNTDVWVVHNGSALFSQASSCTTPEIMRSFSSPVITLAAGDTIDFVVKRNDNYTGDNNTHTYIDANISIQIAREQSWNPAPHNGARHVLPAALLSWLPGDDAVSHDVYFGTDYQAVTDAGRTPGDFDLNGRVDMDDFLILINQWLATPGEEVPTANGTGGPEVDLLDFSLLAGDWLNGALVFRGNQTGTTYNPGGLVAGQTYYWRVDDVAETGMVKGQVWSFTAKTFSDTPAVQTDPVSGDVRIGSEKFELIIKTENGLNPCILRDLQTGRVLADGNYLWPNNILPSLTGAPTIVHDQNGLWTVTFTAMQDDLEIRQVYTIEDAKPNEFTETIRIRNTGAATLYTSGFACGFSRKLDGGDADEVLASRVSQIPYRIQPETGALCDYSLSTVATGQMWYATSRGWYTPGVDDGGKTYTSTFGSEGWAWYDGGEVLLLEKYHLDAMEWSLMKSVSRYAAGETYREKVLRFGGAGCWKLGDPEAAALLAPGGSFTFGTTRYEFIDGTWKDAFYSFRDSMDQKGHSLPANYNPPVHWNELYDNPLWTIGDSVANRDIYYALDDMRVEAEKAYEIGCECLYLDPGWDTNFGSNLWGTYMSNGVDYRLGPQEDFIDAMAVGHDHELALALHTPLAAWSSPSSFPASCKRPDGGLCGSSTTYAAEKAARLIATCNGYETNEGAYFVMFDGNWFVGGCTNPTHGHAIPNTRQDHNNMIQSICQQLHAVHPNVVIEVHDPVIGPGCSRYCPTYIIQGEDGFDELWGYEFMNYTLAEVDSRKAMTLYYVNMAYQIPIYLHINLKTDNEKAFGFWWFASTCKHLGFGGVHSNPVAWQAHKDAMQTYLSLKPFFTQGVFYGIEEAFHAHTLPDQNASVIVCFNLLDSLDPLAFQFDLSEIGLNEGLDYQITGADTAQRTGSTYSISVQTPTHGVKIIQITPVTN